MMPIHEKIRLFRQAKGWTQDEVAEKLELSLNAYGEIERGNSDIRLSRLDQILELFGIDLIELLGVTDKNVFNLSGTNSTGTQNNHNYSANGQMEIDKLQLMLQLKDKEIELRDEKIHHLSELVDLLKAKN